MVPANNCGRAHRHVRALLQLFAGAPSATVLPGLQTIAAMPAASVSTLKAAAAAAFPTAASASASAEVARVKDLEARLAQIEAQSSALRAQSLRLASELEKAQQLCQEGTRMASLVQPPSTWQAHAQGQPLLFIELPISDHAGLASQLNDAQLKSQHKGWFNVMRANEVDMNDALAALRSLVCCCPLDAPGCILHADHDIKPCHYKVRMWWLGMLVRQGMCMFTMPLVPQICSNP